MVDVVVHEDPAGFWAVAGDFFRADPVRHTVPIAVVEQCLRQPERPSVVCVTVHDDGQLVAAAVRTPPWGVNLSGVPAPWADLVAQAYAERGDLPGAGGPREHVEAFVLSWSVRTGASAYQAKELRLFRLDALTPPDVPGEVAVADESDFDLLVGWRARYAVEIGEADLHDEEAAAKAIRHRAAAGYTDLLWRHGGEPVSWAAVNPPRAGMSRVGPVYTPVEHRAHGYASAITSAASAWALDRGAEHVLLFTDLANPTTNSIYPGLGYEPVQDAVDFVFSPRRP
ncbi:MULTISPECIES: GNAT family N-acetyltransferase [Actinosynnema]|uniref:GNAT family N-acetyltransferase n=1 Tax=Actinosynnema TaxID=40566 RepID=UPI0020A5EB6F|nr:GNAT family N-acetyltransferase [Actinosynnema pretiosum]MCP2092712.1 putative acetyltransferase, GNAT family [Actinosynnema pretiosum]